MRGPPITANGLVSSKQGYTPRIANKLPEAVSIAITYNMHSGEDLSISKSRPLPKKGNKKTLGIFF
jgi:hypothetical protein